MELMRMRRASEVRRVLWARDAGHVTKNFPRAIKVPIYQTTE